MLQTIEAFLLNERSAVCSLFPQPADPKLDPSVTILQALDTPGLRCQAMMEMCVNQRRLCHDASFEERSSTMGHVYLHHVEIANRDCIKASPPCTPLTPCSTSAHFTS
jgi:hypothetical protein